MKQNSIDLLSSARNVHSQFGEDGILQALLEVMKIQDGFFVEFGAFDGMKCSNTYQLYTNGWSGCYIEGNLSRFRALENNVPADRVTNVNAFVTIDGENSLDRILSRISAPSEIDLLSIDIDSDDLAVWRSVIRHTAKIVVVEYNPTIPFDTEFENPLGKMWGNSALSLLKLSRCKGYDLVCATSGNLIFLRSDINAETQLPTFDLNKLPIGERYFWGYDGSLLRSSAGHTTCEEVYFVPWAGRSIGVQPVPPGLRSSYIDRRSWVSIARGLSTWFSSALLRPFNTLCFFANRWYRRL